MGSLEGGKFEGGFGSFCYSSFDSPWVFLRLERCRCECEDGGDGQDLWMGLFLV